MSRRRKFLLALVLVLTFAPVLPALAQTGIECDYYGLHASRLWEVICFNYPNPNPLSFNETNLPAPITR